MQRSVDETRRDADFSHQQVMELTQRCSQLESALQSQLMMIAKLEEQAIALDREKSSLHDRLYHSEQQNQSIHAQLDLKSREYDQLSIKLAQTQQHSDTARMIATDLDVARRDLASRLDSAMASIDELRLKLDRSVHDQHATQQSLVQEQLKARQLEQLLAEMRLQLLRVSM